MNQTAVLSCSVSFSLNMNTWKALQRKTYDILSHKYFLMGVFPSLLIFALVLSLIGEVWVKWSGKGGSIKHVSVETNKLWDYSGGGVDVVYTWVNGSDPLLLWNLNVLQEYTDRIEPWTDCPFSDCEPSHIVLYRSCEKLPKVLRDKLPVPNVVRATSLPSSQSLFHNCSGQFDSLISFASVTDATKAVQVETENRTLLHGFWTTDVQSFGTIPCLDWVRLSGLSYNFLLLPTSIILKRLSKHFGGSVLEVQSYPDNGCVYLRLSSVEAAEEIIKPKRLRVVGQVVSSRGVALAFHDSSLLKEDQFAPSRFEDKEELRYSLRSLERHAPWVRHVWIVTNGQVPYWLNLDHPQVTLVTHDDIFPNKSHLPTFSSPAIESHLHRIEGLSDKFIYMNDDIMFAQDVWPEDFYTNSHGYKIYLSWPVPECNEACLWSWVSDGSCDFECNIPECGYDGGDCNETDIGPYSLNARLIKEESSGFYDLQPNLIEMGIENLEKLIQKNRDKYRYHLSPQALVEPQHSHYKIPIAYEKENDSAKTILLRHLNSIDKQIEKSWGAKARGKRAAVKKNLASHEYYGSSMLAGRSADFPGSVTNSKTAINEALLYANKLREARGSTTIMHGTHYSNRSEIVDVQRFSLNKKMNLQTAPGDDGDRADIDNAIREDGLMHRNFKTGPKPWHERGSNTVGPSKIKDFELKVALIKTDVGKGRKRNVTVSAAVQDGVHLPEEYRNLTTRKQRLKYMMEQDFNESSRHVAFKKDPQKLKSTTKPVDSFAKSLLHVNMLYNRIYGFETRRVPAHAPHFIDKNIMSRLQDKFIKEWDETSSHKLRNSTDMQFAFSYYYYLMSEEEDITIDDLFKTFDTDHSGTWSDREIRTLLTRLYPAPLNPHHLIQFEEQVLNCAHNLGITESATTLIYSSMYERYQDSPLPTVTWGLVRGCPLLKKLLLKHLGRRMKYKFEVVRDWNKDVTFKMLHSNVSHLVGHLDDVRRNPKKFVCLNDNLDPSKEKENIMIRAVLRDFYHSFFPVRSRFELPVDTRNRFLYVSELDKWQNRRNKLRTAIILAIITLSILSLAIMYPDEYRHFGRRACEFLCARRRQVSRGRSRLSNGYSSV